MLHTSHSLLKRNGDRLMSDFFRRERQKRSQKIISPFQQHGQAKIDAVQDYLRKRNKIGHEHELTTRQAQIEYEKLEKQASRLRFATKERNTLLGLQGTTDDMPLSIANQQDLSPQESLLHQDEYEYAMAAQPQQSYSHRMSSRVMEGRQWPSLPQSFEMRSVTLSELEHESNMSPSARIYSEKILFHLTRSLKMCPHNVREHIRWEELIVSRVIASRRSARIYIVWSTVTPAARIEMEPLLEKLNSWIVGLIKFNIKTTPNLPQIMWVYDHGGLKEKLPRDLKKQLKNIYGDINTSNKERVKYLQKVDNLSTKMKDVPWFMPYLWSKEKKMATRRAMGDDLQTMEKRKSASGQKPGYVA